MLYKNKKIILIKPFIIFFAIIILVFTPGCAKKREKKATASKEILKQPAKEEIKEKSEKVSKIEIKKVIRGFVTFFSGIVQIDRGKGWRLIEVEDSVEGKNHIKTRDDSFCEIQFTDFCIIRVQENTELSVKDIFLKENKNNVRLKLFTGKLLCKVNKLEKGETFIVQTKAALCAVRGTEFLIKTEKDKATLVAVKKGQVTVIPSSVVNKVEGIKQKVKSKTAKEVVESIPLPKVTVSENQEVLLGRDEDKKALVSFEKITPILDKKIKKIDEKATLLEKKEIEIKKQTSKEEAKIKEEEQNIQEIKNIIHELKAEIITTTNENVKKIQKVIKNPSLISKSSREELKEIKKLKPREILIPSKEPFKEDKITAKPERQKENIIAYAPKVFYTKVVINANPSDALITINGEDTGRGVYSGLYEPGDTLHLKVEKSGFENIEKNIEITREKTQTIKIDLKKKINQKKPEFEKHSRSNKSQEKKILKTVQTPKKLKMSPVKKEPEGGKLEGKKSIKNNIQAFESKPKLLQKTPYNKEKPKEVKPQPLEKKSEVKGLPKIEAEIENKTKINVKKPIVWSIQVAKEKPVRGIIISKNRMIFADKKGKIHCLDNDGKILWTFETNNGNNENSIPVIINDRVYFSGSDEFVVADIKSGNVIKKLPLGKGKLSSHLFGRRVVEYQNQIIFPTNDALVFLNKNSLDETKRIPIPGKSYATPALYNDKIVVLDQRGSLIIINPETSNIELQIKTPALQPVSLAPSILDDKAYFAGRKGTVVAVDLKSGVVLWKKKLKKGIFQDITVSYSGIYPFTGKQFYALSIENGDFMYSPLEASCSPLYYNGKLYYGRKDGTFVINNASEGSVIKTFKLDSTITTKPEMLGNKIVVCTLSGKTYLIDPKAMEIVK